MQTSFRKWLKKLENRFYDFKKNMWSFEIFCLFFSTKPEDVPEYLQMELVDILC